MAKSCPWTESFQLVISYLGYERTYDELDAPRRNGTYLAARSFEVDLQSLAFFGRGMNFWWAKDQPVTTR